MKKVKLIIQTVLMAVASYSGLSLISPQSFQAQTEDTIPSDFKMSPEMKYEIKMSELDMKINRSRIEAQIKNQRTFELSNALDAIPGRK